MDETFATRLAKARMAVPLSQTDLGKEAHIAATQISRYEAGRAVPRAYVLGKLALALNVRPEWLATGEGPMKEPSLYSPTKPPPSFGLAYNKEETERLRAAAEKQGVSLDEFISMAVLEAITAAESVERRGGPPTVAAIHSEIVQQRARLEELAELLKKVDVDRKPEP